MRTAVGLLQNVPLHEHVGPLQSVGLVSNRIHSFIRKMLGSRRPIQGADVAINSFVNALIQYGTADRYAIFTQPVMVSRIAGQLGCATANKAGSGRVTVSDYCQLVSQFPQYEFTNWLDLSLNFAAPSLLRSAQKAPLFPISVIHHTLSYQRMLHDYFVPILLSESFSFDSIVCTTASAQTALVKLLQYVSGELNCQYGLDLKFRGRFDVIPLGIDTDQFRPREKASVRKELGLPQGAFIILYVGRLSPIDKADLMPLIAVFADLVKANADRRLFLVLAGTDLGHYVDIVNQYAMELGVRNLIRPVVGASSPALLYSAADVFISPIDNMQESFGLSVIEAMASGLPQVVSDWNGYRDTVLHGQTGFLVPTYWMKCDADLRDTAIFFNGDASHDHATLAQSVAIDLRKLREYTQCLIENDDLRLTMSHKSRQRAIQVFSWPRVIQSHEALWRDLNRRATTTRPAQNSKPTYLRPIYCEAFGHYPTRLLDDGTRLSLTVEGERALKVGKALCSYHTASELGIIDGRLLSRILDLISHRQSTANSACKRDSNGESAPLVGLEEITRDLRMPSKQECAHRDNFNRHLMWLLKFGYIELREEEYLDDPDNACD